MDLAEQIGQVQATIIRFRRLRDARIAELQQLESGRRTAEARSRVEHIRETLRQIDHGLHPEEGTDPDLDALVRDPDVASLRLAAPGLASLGRLLARLEKQQADEAAQQADDAMPWPRPFRYVGRPNRVWRDGRYLRPGDVVELTKAQAQNWSDLYEPVALAAAPFGSEPDAA